MIKSIFIIAMLALILPACAKLDSNQTMYLSGFNEGYRLGVLSVLAQSNSTAAQEYNALVQQHNDRLNKTLSPQDVKNKLLALVPIPTIKVPAVQAKPQDPWDI